MLINLSVLDGLKIPCVRVEFNHFQVPVTLHLYTVFFSMRPNSD